MRNFRRGEIIMSFDVIENWHKELEVMKNKRGRKFDYPDSFMKLLGMPEFWITVHEGMIRAIVIAFHSS